MTVATIELTNNFTDNTTRKLTIGTFADTADCVQPDTLETMIQNINNNATDLSGIYLSDNGADFQKISSAVLTIAETTEIIL